MPGGPLVIPAIFRAIDQITAPMRGMSKSVSLFTDKASADAVKLTEKLQATAAKAKNIAIGAGIAGAAILTPLALAAKAAITFEDRMADIAKTTGLSGDALDQFGKDLLKISTTTRTSIEDIQKISEIGGQLGVATPELLAFTDASNRFAVALAKDYGGGVEEAITSVGKIKGLFADTRGLAISDVITKAGSAINELGAQGAGTSANINDFILRIGQLPDAIKPSLTNTAALGTFFEEVGINSEIASRGLSDVFLTAGQNISGFAAQMKISNAAARQLLKNDPTAFASKFARSLNGLDPDKLATKLKALKLGDNGSIKTIGALAKGTERLTALQLLANKAFADGTSLNNEYDKKNQTTAAKLQIAQNNIQALAITIGTTLIPIISDLVDKIVPIIQGISDWIKENPKLAQAIIIATAVIGGLFVVLSMLATAIWAVNVAFIANPIGLIIVAVITLIALVIAAISHFETWGRVVLLLLGPFGWLIEILVMLYKHWHMIKKSFKDHGFLGAIMEIGKVLLDFVLYPIQLILEGLSYLPGAIGRAAKSGAVALQGFRETLGVSDSIPDADLTDEQRKARYERKDVAYPQRVIPALNPKTAQNDAIVDKIVAISKGSQEIIIKTAPGVEAEKGKTTGNSVGVKIGSTMTPRQ